MKTIAALFVERDSIYKQYTFIDCYDIDRNALTYTGDMPVIAHPPCQLWGNLAFVNYSRWGGEHNKPGNDGGKFEFALNTVNRCGGVLEHPKNSRAFEKYGLCKPKGKGWERSGDGWVCEVWQSAYGHRANKATWLYFVGVNNPHALIWDRITGSHQIGFHDQRGKSKNKPTLNKKEANATPQEFAVELIALAKEAIHGLSQN